MRDRIVLFSGGAGSWGAARRLADTEGTEGLRLLFTDTLIEDADLYRFLDEAVADIGVELVYMADGRTPWELFHEQGMIGNTRADICSRILKRDLARSWIDSNYPDGADVVFGIDWTEAHRYERLLIRITCRQGCNRAGATCDEHEPTPACELCPTYSNTEPITEAHEHPWHPHMPRAPLTEPPYVTQLELLADLNARGIATPLLYELGFPHNNCGGFCIKAGQEAFAHLYRTLPDRYAEHEAEERAFRDRTGKDVSVMRDRRGGAATPLSMEDFRIRLDAAGEQLELDGWGGCGCMLE